MLKKLAKSIFIVGLASSFVFPVSAENQYYAGGGVSFLSYSEDEISDDASLNALYGRLGMNFNENFSGEIRAGFGVGDDSVNVYGYDVDVELDNFFGAYLRGGIPVTESFFPYAVVGYTRGEVTASALGYSESESESDVSFGVGTDIKVSDNLQLNVEYMNYIDKGGSEIDGFSIGVVTNF